jgi:predicted dehydrogenase
MITVGVIGCGYWGPNLVRNLHSLEHCKVKSICDVNEERLRYLTRLYPDITATPNLDDLIGDGEVDAVAIATPVSLHFDQARRCLEADKHVFIEKPMAASVNECEDLVNLAEKKKKTLMVGHTFIYTAVVRKIREIIKNGDIGDVMYISARRLNLGLFQKDINVAWDLAPHDISIILYLMGAVPESVNCQGKSHVNEGIEDVTTMSLDFQNGGFAIVQSSWLDPNKVREMIIVGSKRMILYNDNEPLEKIRIYDKRVEVSPHYDTFAEFVYSYHYGDIYTPYIKQDEPLRVEMQHFLDCIRDGSVPDSDGMKGLKVVAILEAANASLKGGGSRIKTADFLSSIKQ